MSEWIIPINPNLFEIEEYLTRNSSFIWKAKKPFIEGDIVYVYLTKPVQEILYKCQVTKQGVNEETLNKNLYAKQFDEFKYAEFTVIKKYKKGTLTWNDLHKNGLGQVLMPSRASKKLLDYIEKQE